MILQKESLLLSILLICSFHFINTTELILINNLTKKNNPNNFEEIAVTYKWQENPEKNKGFRAMDIGIYRKIIIPLFHNQEILEIKACSKSFREWVTIDPTKINQNKYFVLGWDDFNNSKYKLFPIPESTYNQLYKDNLEKYWKINNE